MKRCVHKRNITSVLQYPIWWKVFSVRLKKYLFFLFQKWMSSFLINTKYKNCISKAKYIVSFVSFWYIWFSYAMYIYVKINLLTKSFRIKADKCICTYINTIYILQYTISICKWSVTIRIYFDYSESIGLHFVNRVINNT